MPLRFQRHFKIVPGVRLNLNKRGASLSLGHRGAWYTVGTRGHRATVGLPGTGLFWTEKGSPPSAGHQWAFVVVVVLMLLVLAANL
jgi:hypothetical protein